MLNQDRKLKGSFYSVLDTRVSKEIQKWEKIDTGPKGPHKKKDAFVSIESRRGEKSPWL